MISMLEYICYKRGGNQDCLSNKAVLWLFIKSIKKSGSCYMKIFFLVSAILILVACSGGGSEPSHTDAIANSSNQPDTNANSVSSESVKEDSF